jgi:alkyl sulfatase BDS1-like metallo-beta-lactamase superfamily hydrolase
MTGAALTSCKMAPPERIAPALECTRAGQEEILDGVRIVFQMTLG